jgi:DNA primase
MQIRRNTKSFKTILEIITTCHTRPDRRELVRLYITKAGTSIKDRIQVEAIQGDTEFFYDLNYQSVLNNLSASSHQLHQSDDTPGIYFFHSLNKDWDETPFEFDVKVKDVFSSLPDLPAVREKSAPKEFVSPTQQTASPTRAPKKQKEAPVIKQPIMVVHREKQPDYKLKHDFLFTDLDKIFFRGEKLNKKDVLDHYNKISEFLLRYLRNREILVKPTLNTSRLELPEWFDASQIKINDKDHLLYCVELGCIEFDQAASLDHLVIGVDSGSEFDKAVVAVNAVHHILDGLRLPSFVKTDGASGFHVYIPLDSRGEHDTSVELAENVCKLVRLRNPELVVLEGSPENSYGKVTLNHLLNKESAGVVAPYSLVASSPANIATPLEWDEVVEGLRADDFNHKTIFDRLKKSGDPFEHMMRKKVNAEEILARLQENYSFLL